MRDQRDIPVRVVNKHMSVNILVVLHKKGDPVFIEFTCHNTINQVVGDLRKLVQLFCRKIKCREKMCWRSHSDSGSDPGQETRFSNSPKVDVCFVFFSFPQTVAQHRRKLCNPGQHFYFSSLISQSIFNLSCFTSFMQ